ncbi:hypothetical protein D3C79_676260 [compost metagenome]
MIPCHPHVGDDGTGDQNDGDLGDAEDEGQDEEDAHGRDPRQRHDDAGQQGLDEGHADHPLRHRPYGAGAQLGQGVALALIGDANGDAVGTHCARGTPGHHDPRHDEGGDEAQQATAHAGQHADDLLGKIPQLRLVADDEAGQVHRGFQPDGVQLGTHQRNVGDVGGRGRDHQSVVVHLVDQGADAVTQRADHGNRGSHDQEYSQQYQQGRCLALFPAKARGEALVEGIEGNRQDQGPQHHVHEGGEHGEAERSQGQDKTKLDEHIQESGNQSFFDYGKIINFHSGITPTGDERTTILARQKPSQQVKVAQ